MKALRFLLPALLAGLLLPGCFVESLHPLYDKAAPASASDSNLVGSWETKAGADDHPASLVIAQGTGEYYDLKYTEEEKSTELRAAVVQVGGQSYLDVWLESLEQYNVPLAGAAHAIPTHSFWKITREGDSLSLARLNYDRLAKRIKQHKLAVEHTVIDDDLVVLTGSPRQLRAFLQKYSADPSAFARPLVFERKK